MAAKYISWVNQVIDAERILFVSVGVVECKRVVFKSDFGVFKSGEEYRCLIWNYMDFTVYAYDDGSGEPVKSMEFGLVPISE